MLCFKEAKLGLADTGLQDDPILISATEKPATPQITENLSIPYTPQSSICNEIKLKRAVGKIALNFTNIDEIRPHTIYYQIYLDNQLVIDRSAGFEIGADSQLSKTELPYQIDPSDEDLQFDIYFWADESLQIQLDDYQIKAGFGSEDIAAVAARIEKSGYIGIIAEFASTGVSYSYKLIAYYSGVELKSDSANLSISDLFPWSELYFTPLENEIVYLTGISLV